MTEVGLLHSSEEADESQWNEGGNKYLYPKVETCEQDTLVKHGNLSNGNIRTDQELR